MNVSIDAHKKTFFRFLAIYVTSLTLITFATIFPAHGLTYGIGSYGTCQFSSCSITLSSSTTLAANITPGAGTTCTVVKDDVSVRTGSSTGYTLQVNDDDTDTSMNRSGGGAITAISGTQTSPSTLTANTWGYRVDSLSGFGAGPTSAVSNAAVPSVQFAAIPVSGSPDTIATKNSAASVAEVTSVWYGLCSDTSIPAGSYTDMVLYTALTN